MIILLPHQVFHKLIEITASKILDFFFSSSNSSPIFLEQFSTSPYLTRSFLNRPTAEGTRGNVCKIHSIRRVLPATFSRVILLASQSCASSLVAPRCSGGRATPRLRKAWEGWAGQNGPPRALKTIVFNVIG